MKISLKRKEVKSIIEKYYERKNEVVSITLKSSIREVGYYEDKEAYGEIILTRTVDILGTKVKNEEPLSKDVVLGLLNEILSTEGYCVKELTYDIGIKPGGTYTWESNTPSAYFNGIELECTRVKNVERKLNM